MKTENHDNNNITERAETGTPAVSARLKKGSPRGSIALLLLFFAISVITAVLVILHSPDISAAHLLCMFFTLGVLSCAAYTDFYERRIPNMLSLILCTVRLATVVWEWIDAESFPLYSLLESFAGAAIILLMLWLTSAITRGGIGAGDIKLIASVSFLCGFMTALYTLLIAMTFCVFYALILMLLRKKKLNDTVPMGPFFFTGFAVTVILTAA